MKYITRGMRNLVMKKKERGAPRMMAAPPIIKIFLALMENA
jgi:hypothetical protein